MTSELRIYRLFNKESLHNYCQRCIFKQRCVNMSGTGVGRTADEMMARLGVVAVLCVIDTWFHSMERDCLGMVVTSLMTISWQPIIDPAGIDLSESLHHIVTYTLHDGRKIDGLHFIRIKHLSH